MFVFFLFVGAILYKNTSILFEDINLKSPTCDANKQMKATRQPKTASSTSNDSVFASAILYLFPSLSKLVDDCHALAIS